MYRSAWLHLLIYLFLGVWTLPQNARGQTTLFSEDFESYAEGTTDPGDGSWSRNISGATLDGGDHFEVKERSGSNVFEGRDLDGDAIWETRSIDISSFSSVSFSLHLTEDGDLEDGCSSCDYADVSYSTDGGSSFTTITDWNGNGDTNHTLVGNWTAATVTRSGLSGSSLVLRVTMSNNAGSEDIRLDDVEIVEGPTVQFVSSGASVSEGSGSTTLTVEISNPSGNASVEVALDDGRSSADASDLDGYSTQTVNFTNSNDGDTETVSLTITDDIEAEGTETSSFILQNPSNALTFSPARFNLRITDNDASALLISEVMPNPSDVDDSDGEYIEIYNTTDRDIDLNGYDLHDAGGLEHTIGSSVIVPAGRYVVLCDNSSRSANGFVPCDYEWSSISLTNSGDEIILFNGSDAEVDRVEYTDSWPFSAGQSMIFTGAPTDDNNNAANWTGASDRAGYDSQSSGGTDQGTPGGRGADGNLPLTTEIDASAGAGWRMLAVPVSGATVGDLASENLVQGVTGSFPGADPNLYTLFDAPGNETDASYWTPPSGTSTSLTPGRGFIWYFFDNNQAGSVPLPFLLEYSGSANASTVTVTLDNSQQWHLLGNPYAFPFDVSGLTTTQGSGFQTTVQIYDPDTNSYQPIDQTVEGSEGSDTDDLIAAHQGFFVELSSTGSGDVTFEFDPAFRNGAQIPFYKSTLRPTVAPDREKRASSIYRLPLHLTGRAASGQIVTRDKTTEVVIREGATEGWDRWDATKLQPLSAPYASVGLGGTLGNEQKMHVIRSLPLTANGTVEIPLHIVAQGTDTGPNPVGTYRLHWPGLRLPGEWSVELVDSQNGQSVDLRTKEEYVFDAEGISTRSKTHSDPSAASSPSRPNAPTPLHAKADSSSPRFVLRVHANSLPVELTGFDAALVENRAQLTWTTASERNNAGFHVEHRSPEATSFESLAFVEGHGTTDTPQQYRFRTGTLAVGKHTFRLRQVDVDGTTSYSDPVAVRVPLGRAGTVSVSPHPVRHSATVTVRVRAEQEVEVSLYDVLGRRVRTMHAGPMAPGRAHLLSLTTNGLASGLYLLHVAGDAFRTTRRVTVVR